MKEFVCRIVRAKLDFKQSVLPRTRCWSDSLLTLISMIQHMATTHSMIVSVWVVFIVFILPSRRSDVFITQFGMSALLNPGSSITFVVLSRTQITMEKKKCLHFLGHEIQQHFLSNFTVCSKMYYKKRVPLILWKETWERGFGRAIIGRSVLGVFNHLTHDLKCTSNVGVVIWIVIARNIVRKWIGHRDTNLCVTTAKIQVDYNPSCLD